MVDNKNQADSYHSSNITLSHTEMGIITVTLRINLQSGISELLSKSLES
jgi:hypothetical protein